MKWIIRDDQTGEIIAEVNGTKEDARNKYRELEETLEDDGHSWSLYERVWL